MPTRRRPLRRSRGGGGVTPQAVAAFRQMVAIYKNNEGWQEKIEEPRKRLVKLLGRYPWEQDIFFAFTDAPPAWMTREYEVGDWRRARALRVALEAAAESEDA